MSLSIKDRIYQETETEGTGKITLTNVKTGYQGFVGLPNGSSTYYCIINNDSWEVGEGQYVNDGSDTLTRTLLSSSTGALLDLTGISSVFCTYPAEKAVLLNFDGNIYIPDANVQAKKFIGDGSELTGLPNPVDTYTNAEIDAQQSAQDTAIVANNDDIARQQIEINNQQTSIDKNASDITTESGRITTNTTNISTNTGNISSNTTAIGTLSGQVSQNSEDIAELQDSIFFSSAYSADYPASPNRDPNLGNMYLQNFAMFTYSYAEATQIFCSKTDESGNVRQFTAIKEGDSIVLNQVDSPNYGRYELVSVEDVGDYVMMVVNPKL